MAILNATVKEKTMVTDALALFKLGLQESVPPFVPGQFMMVGTEVDSKYLKRAYSIVSTPSARELEFCIKAYEQGRVAKYILQVPQGGTLRVEGPYGKFVLNGSTKDKLLIAAGTGIAPIMSMARTLLEKGFSGTIRVFYGASYVQTLVYNDELSTYAKKHKNFTYVPTISREAPEWAGERGRVEDILPKHIRDAANAEAYICGPPPMVQNVIAFLKSVGFDAADVHAEQFW